MATKRKPPEPSAGGNKAKKQKASTMAKGVSFPVGTPIRIAGVSQYSYRIEPFDKAGNVFFLVNLDTEERLKCGPNRRLKNNGGRGEWSRWLVEDNDEDGFSLQNVGFKDVKDQNVYLGVSHGIFAAVDEPQFLTFEEVSDQDKETCSAPNYELSTDSIKQFIDTGVLQLVGLIDRQLVDNALVSINEALGEAWNGTDDSKDCRDRLKRSPAILDLMYKSPLLGVIEQMLGKGNVTFRDGAQIALRFPNNRNPNDLAWHIDGTDTTHMTPFQILVGIALSSIPTDDCGNLVVAPGKHGEVYEAVARHRQQRQEGNADSNNQGNNWLGCRPVLSPDDFEQVKMEPGDVVLAQQKIPHRVAHNSSPNIRYMVYFRMTHKKHVPNAPLDGLWAHFDSIEEIVGECSSTG